MNAAGDALHAEQIDSRCIREHMARDFMEHRRGRGAGRAG
jgi:hypothetical protein